MANEELIVSIKQEIDRLNRIKYNKVIICHPDMAEVLEDQKDSLGIVLYPTTYMPKDKIYLIDRDEYDRWESWGN